MQAAPLEIGIEQRAANPRGGAKIARGLPGKRLQKLLGPIQLARELARSGEPERRGMTPGVIADQVPTFSYGLHHGRMRGGSPADTEKGGRHPALAQDLEHLGSHLGVRTVVESECHAAGRDVRGRELAEIGSQKAAAGC